MAALFNDFDIMNPALDSLLKSTAVMDAIGSYWKPVIDEMIRIQRTPSLSLDQVEKLDYDLDVLRSIISIVPVDFSDALPPKEKLNDTSEKLVALTEGLAVGGIVVGKLLGRFVEPRRPLGLWARVKSFLGF